VGQRHRYTVCCSLRDLSLKAQVGVVGGGRLQWGHDGKVLNLIRRRKIPVPEILISEVTDHGIFSCQHFILRKGK
jgi:hypothetical protein